MQISDENVHHVRELMDEVFDKDNFFAAIPFKTKIPLRTSGLAGICDYSIYYAKNKKQIKFRKLYFPREFGRGSEFVFVETTNGSHRRIHKGEETKRQRLFRRLDLSSARLTPSCVFPVLFNGATYNPTHMRENQLLAPVRHLANHGDRKHEGRIQTDRPNELWMADAARFYRRDDGWCWFFGAVDHCSEDIVGWHAAKRGDRWAELEPIRQGIRTHYSNYAKKIALGLGLRHDLGPQYCANQFLGELRWLGIRSTPPYVGEPDI